MLDKSDTLDNVDNNLGNAGNYNRLDTSDILDFVFDPIDERMYVVISDKDALIVDPNQNMDALKYLKEKHVENVLILLTHEHYDHIFGVNMYRQEFSNTRVLSSKRCGEMISDSSMNLSNYWQVLFQSPKINQDHHIDVEQLGLGPYRCHSDIVFEDTYEMDWNGHKLFMKETPGHSEGSICIIMDDKLLFSGDSLVTGFPTVTRLPGGSKSDYNNITVPWLKSIGEDIFVFPGHGDRQIIGEYWKERK